MTEEGGSRVAGAGIRRVSKVPATKSEGDLLRRRIVSENVSTKVGVDRTAAAEEGEEVELSLGLSLNGRFGVDPSRAQNIHHNLKRSSSVVDFNVVAPAMMMMMRGGEAEEEEEKTTCRVPMMMRTCSLPSETEEEWRRRKEQQCLRRMEAKRKRSEKQQRMISSTNYSKVPRNRSRENFDELVNNGGGGGCPLPPMMPENLGSQGSGSSGVTDDSHAAAQAAHKCSEAGSDESLPKSEKEPIVTHQMTTTTEDSGQLNGAVQMQNRSENSTNSDKETKESVRDVLENMPSVSTRGDGTNGRRIEGFLYRYRNGEEVRIVCVCHGSFLTPAEFVEHAGGGDVLHPLRHIVVNPSPIL